MKEKILYLTMTDWFWARQRPQFIAEGLSHFYNVTYVYPKTYNTKNITKNSLDTHISPNLVRFLRLPLERFQFIRSLNKLLFRLFVKGHLARNDILWISHPLIFDAVKDMIPKRMQVIYDCMDDFSSFPAVLKDQNLRNTILKNEEALVRLASRVIFSSITLRKKVLERYNLNRESTIINNAVGNIFLDEMYKKNLQSVGNDHKGSNKKAIYIGTISSWFDFDLIIESLNRFPGLIYVLAGPSEISIPPHDRIIYIGPIPHHRVSDMLTSGDLLVMPFRQDEIVMSVDPVKVYEYLTSGKPIIVPDYAETFKFNDFVYRYRNSSDYLSLIELLFSHSLQVKKSGKECFEFLRSNTWDVRIKEIIRLLNKDI